MSTMEPYIEALDRWTDDCLQRAQNKFTHEGGTYMKQVADELHYPLCRLELYGYSASSGAKSYNKAKVTITSMCMCSAFVKFVELD